MRTIDALEVLARGRARDFISEVRRDITICSRREERVEVDPADEIDLYYTERVSLYGEPCPVFKGESWFKVRSVRGEMLDLRQTQFKVWWSEDEKRWRVETRRLYPVMEELCEQARLLVDRLNKEAVVEEE